MPARRHALPHALVLLLALLLGWAAHGWHHVAEPACDDGGAGHACVTCSALHGPSLTATSVVAAAPVRAVVRAAYHAPVAQGATAQARRPGAPRAPPAA